MARFLHPNQIRFALLLFALLVLGWASEVQAEQAYVRGEVRLNVRSGAGTGFRILGVVKTGDAVTVLSRGEGWTQIRLPDDKEGWIPGGYLEENAPPTIRLGHLESEVERLQQELATTQGEAGELKSSQSSMHRENSEMKTRLEKLTKENHRLKAGQLWPTLVAGAGILLAGMLIQSVLSSLANRPGRRRIKL